MGSTARFMQDSLQTAAAVVGLMAFGTAALGDNLELAWILAGTAIAMLTTFAIVHAREVRKGRYLAAIEPVIKAYDMCVHAASGQSNTEQSVRGILAGAAQQVAKAYAIITGTDVHVSVQRLRELPGGDLAVGTFCRSDPSSGRPLEADGAPRKLADNTDLVGVFDDVSSGRVVRVFRANALPLRIGYKSSSYDAFGRAPTGSVSMLARYVSWKLPYRSTMVAPILSSMLEPDVRRHCLVGFLCVDSRRSFVFRKRDEILLAGLAAAMHPIMYGMLMSLRPSEGDDAH